MMNPLFEAEPEEATASLGLRFKRVASRVARVGCLTAAIGIFRARDAMKTGQHVVLLSLSTALPVIYNTAVWLDPTLDSGSADGQQLQTLFWSGATLQTGKHLRSLDVVDPVDASDIDSVQELQELQPPAILPSEPRFIKPKPSIVSLRLGRRKRLKRTLHLQRFTRASRCKATAPPSPTAQPPLQSTSESWSVEMSGDLREDLKCTADGGGFLTESLEAEKSLRADVVLSSTAADLPPASTVDDDANKQGKMQMWLPIRKPRE